MVPRRLVPFLALAAPLVVAAADPVAVRFAPAADAAQRSAALQAAGVRDARTADVHVRVGEAGDAERAAARLRRAPGVAWAAPRATARAAAAAGWFPSDPGLPEDGSWRVTQWNFAGPEGVRAPEAWRRLRDVRRAGGRGVTVAVLDTGVAYRDAGVQRRSPGLARTRFVSPYDAIEGDRRPDDDAGHGTHVASTIAENVSDRAGVTGLAHGVRIMPVKVLGPNLEGDAVQIAKGLRWAVRKGADVVNLSMEFEGSATSAELEPVARALRSARRAGVTVVAATGNGGRERLAYPASSPDVIAVGATTERGCRAAYSNAGTGIDLVAPGGGADSADGADARCAPNDPAGGPIVQTTYAEPGRPGSFVLSTRYVGTSQAAAHVSAAAALVRASRVVGADPSPARVRRRLAGTAADRGPAGSDQRYGAGLLDAGAAVGAR